MMEKSGTLILGVLFVDINVFSIIVMASSIYPRCSLSEASSEN
jgi:hypothetical protein